MPRRKRVAFVLLVLAALTACGVRTEPVRLSLALDLAWNEGGPVAGEPVRLVTDADPDPRAPDAGRVLQTTADGRLAFDWISPLPRAWTTLDNGFIPHRSRRVEFGLGLDLAGEPALYWFRVDQVAGGTLLAMEVFVPDRQGRFVRPLQFHDDTHTWSNPADARGLRFTDVGLDHHGLSLDEAADGGAWRLHGRLERQVFTVR